MELDQAADLAAGERCLAADPLAAGAAGAAAAPPALADLPEAERRVALVAETARFAKAFLRWTEARTADGLPYTRLRLLQALHCDGPAIMRDLGDQLGVSPRNMTAMVDALEDARLVVRRPHPTDRRATLVELTPVGVQEAEQVLSPRFEAMAELFDGFSAAEQETFAAALGRLSAAMRSRPHGAC